MNILITGGTGFVGAELARVICGHDDKVVLFDVNPNYRRISDFKDQVKVVQGNLSNWQEVMNVVKENDIQGIYHFGGILSVPSEANPWNSFQVNVIGTVNVLEAARLFGVDKVIFSSSLATYGPGIEYNVTDETIQRPTTMYGCSKVYGELLGSYYRRKFGLDFRTIRFPSIVGPGVRTPGVAQYTSWMIEYAINGKPYECFVSEETKSPAIYFKDAVMCSEILFRTEKEKIKTVNYLVAGITPSLTAKEIELTIKRYLPFQVTYNPDPEIMRVYSTLHLDKIDDTNARLEWGWKSQYDSYDKIVPDFTDEMRLHPGRYRID